MATTWLPARRLSTLAQPARMVKLHRASTMTATGTSFGYYEIGADETATAFPLAAILYPSALWGGQAASQPAAQPSADALYKIYLPVIYNVGGASWLGQLDSFAFDPASGIQVLTGGYALWNPSVFSADQEVYFTFTALSPSATRQDLLLKVGDLAPGGLIGPNTYLMTSATTPPSAASRSRPSSPAICGPAI